MDCGTGLLRFRRSAGRSRTSTLTGRRRIEALIESGLERGSETLRPYGLFAADRSIFDANRLNAHLAADPLGVLAVFFPEELRAELVSYLPEGGISEEARQARLVQIDADLEAAAIAEEVALRDLEEALGSEVPRREDARADILLALDGELGR